MIVWCCELYTTLDTNNHQIVVNFVMKLVLVQKRYHDLTRNHCAIPVSYVYKANFGSCVYSSYLVFFVFGFFSQVTKLFMKEESMCLRLKMCVFLNFAFF